MKSRTGRGVCWSVGLKILPLVVYGTPSPLAVPGKTARIIVDGWARVLSGAANEHDGPITPLGQPFPIGKMQSFHFRVRARRLLVVLRCRRENNDDDERHKYRLLRDATKASILCTCHSVAICTKRTCRVEYIRSLILDLCIFQGVSFPYVLGDLYYHTNNLAREPRAQRVPDTFTMFPRGIEIRSNASNTSISTFSTSLKSP